jgi:hypothetical protein
MLVFELLPGTNAVNLRLQTYGADGVLDVGANDYNHAGHATTSSGVASLSGGASGAAAVPLTPTVGAARVTNNASSGGIAGCVKFYNIRVARFTRMSFETAWGPDADSTLYFSYRGVGFRLEADVITASTSAFRAARFQGRPRCSAAPGHDAHCAASNRATMN